MKSYILIFGLLIAITLSSVKVVAGSYSSRQMFSQLHELEQHYRMLIVERGKLLIERSSLTTPAKIEAKARDELQMRVPNVDEVRVINP
jgi:cell division protein FtsL